MKCRSCGEEIRDDARFCGYCGAAQTVAEEVQLAVEDSVSEVPEFVPGETAPETIVEEAPLSELPELEVAAAAEPEVIVEETPAAIEEPVPEPTSEQMPEPVAEVTAEPAPEPVAEPVAVTVAQAASQAAPEPVAVPIVQPQPAPITQTQPMYQPPQPQYQPAQPVYQAPQPQYQSQYQPQYQPPQPQYQPQYQAPQPQYQPQYQPVQPVYQTPRPQYQPAQPVYQAPQPRPAYVQQPHPVNAGNSPIFKLPTRRGLGKMFWLGLLTCGIYPMVIMSRIPEEMNMVASRYDGKRTQQYLWLSMLTALTFGIYAFVWIHNLCNRMGAELKRRRIDYKFDAATFWLWNILGSFILVGPFIYIHKMMKAMNLINRDYNEKG